METAEIRRFRRLARSLSRQMGALAGEEVCCGGVTVRQCHVLFELEERGSVGLVELAHALRLDKSTVSRTVDGLVEQELLDRSIDPSDRRCNVLTLTPKGESTVAAVHAGSDELMRRMFEHIPEERHGDVVDSVRLLVEACEVVEEAENHCCEPAKGEQEEKEGIS